MATTAEILSEARQFHHRGELGPAEARYRQVLQAEPANLDAIFLLGTVCHQTNRLEEAIGHYRHVVRLQPNAGVVYLNLADALQQRGLLSDAAECLRQCLFRLPQFPEAHYNLGNVLGAMGRPDEAAAHFQEAIRLRPGFAQAHNNLGNVFLLQQKPDDAVVHYAEAVRLQPTYAEAHYNVGNALREQQRVGEAIAAYLQALALQPDNAALHNNLAEAYLELGDRDLAEAHWRRALASHPGFVAPLLQLAAHGMYGARDPSVEQLRARLTDPRLSPEPASQLHFVLGSLLDRAGAIDEAFEHYRQGNALRRALFQKAGAEFDARECARRVDRVIGVFSADYFARQQGVGLDTEVPVFIVGMQRSGSTLVQQILAQHSQVHAAGELKDVWRLVTELPARLGTADGYPECLVNADPARLREIAEAHLARLTAWGGSAVRMIDKMLDNFLYLGLIATLFPRARVIHCRRNPVDTCVSCYLQYFKGLSFAWDLDDLGRYYREYHRLMAYWRTVLPLRMLDVVYEELVVEPEAVSRQLIDFCGLQWEDSCLRHYESRRPVQTMSKLQVRQPIYTSSIGRWQRYAAHLGPLLEALGGDGATTGAGLA
jgi:tetratricopeptide (TPR) repeat protein